jgi:hypothetical protein
VQFTVFFALKKKIIMQLSHSHIHGNDTHEKKYL